MAICFFRAHLHVFFEFIQWRDKNKKKTIISTTQIVCEIWSPDFFQQNHDSLLPKTTTHRTTIPYIALHSASIGIWWHLKCAQFRVCVTTNEPRIKKIRCPQNGNANELKYCSHYRKVSDGIRHYYMGNAREHFRYLMCRRQCPRKIEISINYRSLSFVPFGSVCVVCGVCGVCAHTVSS